MRQILLVATLLHGSSIWATEPITPKHSILIACAFPERLWAFADQNGVLAGIAVDVHAYFARATGRRIRTEACSVRSAIERLKDGTADLALLPETEDLEAWADAVMPAYRARATVLPRTGVVVQRNEDLRGLTIAAPEEEVLDARLEHEVGVKTLTVGSAEAALDLLLEGRVDAVIGNASFYRYAASRRGIDPSEAFGPPFPLGERTVWVYVSRKVHGSQFATKLQKAFTEVSLEDLIKDLRDHYYRRAISGR